MNSALKEREENREESIPEKRKPRKKKLKAVILLVILLAGVISGSYITYRIMNKGEEEISDVYISEKLEEISEFTTAKETMTGWADWSDGKMDFLSKKSFTILYAAEIEAFFDFSKIKTEISDDSLKIIMPEVQISDVSIDPDKVKLVDFKRAVFNWHNSKDGVKAMSLAKKDALKKTDVENLKKVAENKAESLLQSVFKDIIGNRKLIIEFK